MGHHRRSKTFRNLTDANSYEREDTELDELCSSLNGSTSRPSESELLPADFISADFIPPFECFATQIRSSEAKKKLLLDLQVGDELCVRVKRVELAAIYVQPLCVWRPFRRYLKWIDNFQVLIPRDVRENGLERPNDLLKVVVTEIGGTDDLRLRLCDGSARMMETDLPLYFRNSEALEKDESFNSFLCESRSLTNANLAELFAFKTESTSSFLPELRDKKFSMETKAFYFRKKQNEDLSMQSVVKGVEKVRAGEYTPAVQHFFKALEIYERNVEALVGRAAAYANMGKYDLAENDLDAALAINSDHVNAKAYMVEVLIKAANKMMNAKEVEEAKKKYSKILKFKDDKRARDALKQLKKDSKVEVSSRKRRYSTEELSRKSREAAKEGEQRRSEAKKLAEMEQFIAKLKEETRS